MRNHAVNNDEIFETGISEEVYHQNYRYGDDRTVADTWKRNATALASVEENDHHWTKKFYNLLSGRGLPTGPFPFTPGGRIFANAGTGLGKASLVNCFVAGARGRDQDSMDEIQAELTRQAKILASEGGYGFCASFMRPRGGRIGGVGSMTPGAVQMLDTWNTQAATIVAGSGMKSDRDDVKNKIRKGAQMVTMHVWHPDVIEFIKAKQEPGRLHKFNMSLMVSDEFMKAVRHDEKWALRFPAYEEEPEFYREHWDGNLQAYEDAGGTVKVWRDPETGEKQIYDAREIWDLITRSTYERNEPGVLFYDTINKENNLNYAEHIDATNPSLRAGTKTLTSEGIYNIEDLEGQDLVVSNLDQSMSAAECFLSGESETLYRVELETGKEIYCTAEHKHPVALKGKGNDFVRTETTELEEGHLLKFPDRRNELPIGGSDLKRDDGFMIGWLFGDGWITNREGRTTQYGFVFNSEEKYIAEKIVDVVNRHSGSREVSVTYRDSDGCYYIQVGNQAFDEFLREIGVTSKSDLPKGIWSSSDEVIKGFVDGLFSADGFVEQETGIRDNPRLQLTSADRSLIEDVLDLMSFYGIKSRITDQEMSDNFGNGQTYQRYNLEFSAWPTLHFAETFSFTHHEKESVLESIRGHEFSRSQPLAGMVRVSSVEETNLEEPVWDVSVYDDTHCFEIGGYTTGNCGEQVLPPGGVCLLGNFNLTQFLTEDYSGFDFDLLEQLVPSAVRFLDNVNDLSYVPTERQEKNLQQKRRIGLGHYGDGSALMMMGVRYGSEEGFRTMRQFQEKLANLAYQASARLAKEKEPFPLFDREHYLNEAPFVQRLSSKTKEMIAAHGLRNSHLLSIQPTGNTSTLANAPSSGIEPVFMFSYTRTSEQPSLPDEVDRPEVIDHDSGIISGANAEQWEIEEQGDENIARCVVEGHTEWQIHPTRGIVKDSVVEDYGVRRLKERGEWDPDAHWAVTTRDLEVDDHITQMKALAPFVDSAMSKTINVPNDYPFEDFQEVYTKAHRTGVIKGVTTYRAGTMSAVLSSTDDEGEEDGVPTTDAPERPEELDCNIYRVRYSGDRWKIFVGHLDGDPYEVFARPPQKTYPRITDSSGKAIDEGTIRKVDSGHYQLIAPDGKVVIENIAEDTTDDEVKEQTRLVSTALRHGTPLHYIVKQLEKAEGSIASFGRAMAKALKQETDDLEVTCDSCGSANVKHVEGCLTCQECGHSHCS